MVADGRLHLGSKFQLWEKCVLHIPLALILVLVGYKLWQTIEYFVYVWRPSPPGQVPQDLPMVTIQLPMYNERAVYQRCIEVACNVRWPKEKLDIIVIDDSDQEDLIAEIDVFVKGQQRKGFPVRLVRRPDRVGYKAGALAFATQYSRGEFFAMFDTDFCCTEDFLERTIPYFYTSSGSANDIGLVQCPWGWLNGNYNLLTKAQAIWLDAHFIIEQMVRSKSVQVFGFNGTAGVWRRQAIFDGGHWSWDSVTEDCDLGYRAFLAGYKHVFIPDLPQPCELPIAIVTYKAQQHRWIKGFPQIMMKLLLPLMTARHVPVRAKVEAFFHLLGGFGYVLAVVQLIIYPGIVFLNGTFQPTWPYYLPLIAASFFYLVAAYERERIYRRASVPGCLLGVVYSVIPILAIFVIHMGLSLLGTYAWFEGWYSKDATFHATPKDGSQDKKPVGKAATGRQLKPKKARVKLHWIVVVENLMWVYFLAASYLLWWNFGLSYDLFTEAIVLPIAALAFAIMGIPSVQQFFVRLRKSFQPVVELPEGTQADEAEDVDIEVNDWETDVTVDNEREIVELKEEKTN